MPQGQSQSGHSDWRILSIYCRSEWTHSDGASLIRASGGCESGLSVKMLHIQTRCRSDTETSTCEWLISVEIDMQWHNGRDKKQHVTRSMCMLEMYVFLGQHGCVSDSEIADNVDV